MPPGALDERLRAGMAVFFQQPLFETSRIHADADRDMARAAGLGHSPDVFLAADVAGVDADLVNAARRRLERQTIVEMDVSHERDVDALLYGADSFGRAHVGDRHAHDIAARLLKGEDLADRGLYVPGLGVAHRLDAYGCAAAHGDGADGDLFGVFSLHVFVTILKISWNIT